MSRLALKSSNAFYAFVQFVPQTERSSRDVVLHGRTVIKAHRSIDAKVPVVTLSVIVVVVHNVSREIDNRAKWPFPSRLSHNNVINYYYLLIFTNNSSLADFDAAFVVGRRK